MTSFVYDDFLRIVHKAARKYSAPQYKNIKTEVIINKVLVSMRAHLADLEEETKWKQQHNIHDSFLLDDEVHIPDSDEIQKLLNMIPQFRDAN